MAEADLQAAVEHVRRQAGSGVTVTTAAREGSRLRVLALAARDARLLVLGRQRARARTARSRPSASSTSRPG